MAIGDPVQYDPEVFQGNIAARNDLPKTTFSKSQIERRNKGELSFFKNSGAMRFELSNNERSVMLVMRPATQEKNDKNRPIYDNQNRVVMSLKQPDIQALIYYIRYAPDVENIQPVKLYHEHDGGSKSLILKYNAENGGFNFNLEGKHKEGQSTKAWITLSGQEALGVEILLTRLFVIILGF